MTSTPNPINVLNTTVVRTALRAFVAAVVSTLISWASVKIGSFHGTVFTEVALFGTPIYFAAVLWLETKFPALGWLLGLLPQPKLSPAPAPVPAPTPVVPAVVPPAKPAVGVKKAAKSSGSKAVK